jgi:hypothetical protein
MITVKVYEVQRDLEEAVLKVDGLNPDEDVTVREDHLFYSIAVSLKRLADLKEEEVKDHLRPATVMNEILDFIRERAQIEDGREHRT